MQSRIWRTVEHGVASPMRNRDTGRILLMGNETGTLNQKRVGIAKRSSGERIFPSVKSKCFFMIPSAKKRAG